MRETFRWFGKNDAVTLADIKQTGASGVVTALHHIPNGKLWPLDDLQKFKTNIEANGMDWSFIESIPIHEHIKLRQGDYLKKIETYKQSLRHVAKVGIKGVCYNFMPVLDWTRTHLYWKLENGSTALRFDKVDMAVFEAHIMKRNHVEESYNEQLLREAAIRFKTMSSKDKKRLETNILKGLPGTVEDLDIPKFKVMVDAYKDMSHEDLKSNLSYFLNEIIPLAEELGIKMAIHPDDPPFDILGLPRIITSEKDLDDLVNFIDSPSNGITFCTGSLGARAENNLPEMIEKFKTRIHFLHLRNVKREDNGSFFEDQHLEGSSDMYQIVKAILKIEKELNVNLPMRPDHGHQMLDDLNKPHTYAGYTAIGRLKGLAELRGLQMGILKSQVI